MVSQSQHRSVRAMIFLTIGSIVLLGGIWRLIGWVSNLRDFDRIQQETIESWKAEAEQCLRLAENHESLADAEEKAADDLMRLWPQFQEEVGDLRRAAASRRRDAAYRRQRAAYARAKAGESVPRPESSTRSASSNGLYVPPDFPEPVGAREAN